MDFDTFDESNQASQGVDYDWIEVLGTATLAGTIDVNWWNGYIGHGPFTVLTAAGGITNTNFNGITFLFDGASYGEHEWRASIVSLGGSAEALVLELVPEPASALLLLTALPALVRQVRRRRIS